MSARDSAAGECLLLIYRLKPGMGPEYDRRHKEVWPALLAKIGEAGVYDYQIWRYEEIVISRLRTRRGYRAAEAVLQASAIQREWTASLKDVFESYETPEGESFWLNEVFRFGMEGES